MIVPMKKVSVVILEKERQTALKALRKLGVIHLEEIQGNSERLSVLHENYSKTEKAIAVLSEIKLHKKEIPVQKKLEQEETLRLAEKVMSLAEQKKNCQDRITADTVEIERLSGWGKVIPADILYLDTKKIFLSMYEVPRTKYTEISPTVKTLLVNSDKSIIRFLVLSETRSEERQEGLPPEAYQVVLPRCSTEELSHSIAENQKQITAIDKELAADKQYNDALLSYKALVQQDEEFENIYSGMGCEKDDPQHAVTELAWLSGFVPEDDVALLKKTAGEQKWALLFSEPAPDESVPTKLHNNKLVSLIYPLTDFLGTVPGYHEFDISGWFLLFFSIFFGMIFGDAGYGLLMTAGTLLGMLAAKKSGKSISSGLCLILLLSLVTVVWGTVTCTWFGLTMDQLPGWIKAISVPPLSSAYSSHFDGVHSLFTTDQNLQIFCFTLALLQLSVAHLKCFIRDIHSLKSVGDLGSLFMLWGMYYIVLMLVVSGAVFSLDKVVAGIPIGMTAVVLIAVGFLMNFIFSNYEGSVGKSILESLKNIISVILGVVNVFSDIVSYIRLWAVALAGSAISGTVNQMAGPLWGHAVLFLAFVVLLVFGHGLNMILNVLSVIVHGVRLNTLEFSSHLGMAWSGYKYKPFSETVKN